MWLWISTSVPHSLYEEGILIGRLQSNSSKIESSSAGKVANGGGRTVAMALVQDQVLI